MGSFLTVKNGPVLPKPRPKLARPAHVRLWSSRQRGLRKQQTMSSHPIVMSGVCRINRCVFMAAVTAAGQLLFGPICYAQEQIDIVTFFHQARRAGRDGLARKTKAVDVRAAKVGEIIETVIKGEGKETQSPPAKGGDKVVRNRCPATGNEEILVTASKFTKRYTGTTGVADANGWLPYRPRGVQMRFVLVPEQHGEFSFIAPWGEKMVARPGDAIVQDLKNLKDTYRVQKVAFACTYEVIRQPRP